MGGRFVCSRYQHCPLTQLTPPNQSRRQATSHFIQKTATRSDLSVYPHCRHHRHRPRHQSTHAVIVLQVPLGLIDSRVDTIIWPPARFGPVLAPDLSKESERRKSHRGPAWRKEMAEFDRERRRQARVAVAVDGSSAASEG